MKRSVLEAGDSSVRTNSSIQPGTALHSQRIFPDSQRDSCCPTGSVTSSPASRSDKACCRSRSRCCPIGSASQPRAATTSPAADPAAAGSPVGAACQLRPHRRRLGIELPPGGNGRLVGYGHLVGRQQQLAGCGPAGGVHQIQIGGQPPSPRRPHQQPPARGQSRVQLRRLGRPPRIEHGQHHPGFGVESQEATDPDRGRRRRAVDPHAGDRKSTGEHRTLVPAAAQPFRQLGPGGEDVRPARRGQPGRGTATGHPGHVVGQHQQSGLCARPRQPAPSGGRCTVRRPAPRGCASCGSRTGRGSGRAGGRWRGR